jgi:hypothetical protein
VVIMTICGLADGYDSFHLTNEDLKVHACFAVDVVKTRHDG